MRKKWSNSLTNEQKAVERAHKADLARMRRKLPHVIEAAKKYQNEYRQRDYAKEAHRQANNIYNHTPAAKICKKRYRDSEKGKQKRREWLDNGSGIGLMREYRKKYNDTEQGHITSRRRLKRYREKMRLGLITFLGIRCIKCGFDNLMALDLDHIGNNGSLERKRFGHYRQEWAYYIQHKDELKANFQVLCRNCNWIKHVSRLGVYTDLIIRDERKT